MSLSQNRRQLAAARLVGLLLAFGLLAAGLLLPAAPALADQPAAGQLYAWGSNGNGELGDGTTTQRNTPVSTLYYSSLYSNTGSLSGVIAVASGNAHTVALTNVGTVWAWGYNYYGQIGNGQNDNGNLVVNYTTSATQVVGPNGIGDILFDITAVAAGGDHSLALRSDGTVWAWGDNSSYQLGLGGGTTAKVHSVPQQVVGPSGSGSKLTGIVAVAASWGHNLALRHDGTVWAWGNNANGQLGNGTTTTSSCPVQVLTNSGTPLTGIVAIAAGGRDGTTDFSVAVKNDGTVWTWGFNDRGELGNNTTSNTSSAVQVINSNGTPFTGAVAVTAGDYNVMVLMNNGTVYGWGGNGYGQLGDGSTTNRWTPVPLLQSGSPMTGIVSVAEGAYHTVLLTSGSNVYCVGNNTGGELGNGTTVNSSTPVLVASNIVGIAAGHAERDGYGCSFAIYGSSIFSASVQTMVNPPGAGLVTVSPTNTFGLNAVACVTQTPNSGWTFQGWTFFYNATFLTSTLSQEFLAITDNVGGTGLIALANYVPTAGGVVYTWGDNTYGELGSSNRPGGDGVPEPATLDGIIPLTGAIAVAAGSEHSVYLTNSGSVFAWGDNTYGQLGNGTDGPAINPDLPYEVVAPQGSGKTYLSDVVKIVAIAAGGSTHTAAVGADGTVWCWGNNQYGELGHGSTGGHSDYPLQVPGFSSTGNCGFALAVAVGPNNTMVLNSYGMVFCWGRNASGQLGIGTTTDTNSPGIPVRAFDGVLAGIVAVAAGNAHNLALDNYGNVWGWGDNTYCQLGAATMPYPTNEAQYVSSSLSYVSAIAAGGNHNLARQDKQTHAKNVQFWNDESDHLRGPGYADVWGWGWNDSYDIDPTVSNSVPIINNGWLHFVGNVTAVAAGSQYSVFTMPTGIIYACGGQPGYEQYPLPVIDSNNMPFQTVAAVSVGSSHVVAIGADPSSAPVKYAPYQPANFGLYTGGYVYIPLDQLLQVQPKSLIIQVTPNPGFDFVSWSVTGGSVDYPLSTMATLTFSSTVAGSCQIQAIFAAETFTVVGVASPTAGGAVSVGSATGTIGQVVSISQTTNPGYAFVGWSLDDGDNDAAFNSDSTAVILGSNSVTVTASFTVAAGTFNVSATTTSHWVYQNTTATTKNRHAVPLTMAISGDTWGNTSYTATVTVSPTPSGTYQGLIVSSTSISKLGSGSLTLTNTCTITGQSGNRTMFLVGGPVLSGGQVTSALNKSVAKQSGKPTSGQYVVSVAVAGNVGGTVTASPVTITLLLLGDVRANGLITGTNASYVNLYLGSSPKSVPSQVGSGSPDGWADPSLLDVSGQGTIIGTDASYINLIVGGSSL